MEIAIEIKFQCDIVESVGVQRLKTTNKEIEIASIVCFLSNIHPITSVLGTGRAAYNSFELARACCFQAPTLSFYFMGEQNRKPLQ